MDGLDDALLRTKDHVNVTKFYHETPAIELHIQFLFIITVLQSLGHCFSFLYTVSRTP
jgi:hypothetical protein